MKFKKILPYNIKRIIPMLGIAGATMFLGGCEKETPQHDIELNIKFDDLSSVAYVGPNSVTLSDEFKAYAADDAIRNIYIVPVGEEWKAIFKEGITNIRNMLLEPAIKYSSKVKGRGDFNFYPGQASLVPDDSLWYENHGWTINERFHQKSR